jgi:hypothetical protein
MPISTPLALLATRRMAWAEIVTPSLTCCLAMRGRSPSWFDVAMAENVTAAGKNAGNLFCLPELPLVLLPVDTEFARAVKLILQER